MARFLIFSFKVYFVHRANFLNCLYKNYTFPKALLHHFLEKNLVNFLMMINRIYIFFVSNIIN